MDVLPFLVNGLVLGGIYAMVAIGFSIIFTTTRTFHFAHGAIYLFAGYAIHFVTEQLRWSLWARYSPRARPTRSSGAPSFGRSTSGPRNDRWTRCWRSAT
jgi:hypothetical protein